MFLSAEIPFKCDGLEPFFFMYSTDTIDLLHIGYQTVMRCSGGSDCPFLTAWVLFKEVT